MKQLHGNDSGRATGFRERINGRTNEPRRLALDSESRIRSIQRIVIRVADANDREAIYHLRHDVYARELGQHTANATGRLMDSLDGSNIYLVAAIGNELAGFISITPPGGAYSVDKYLRRQEFPELSDPSLHELRLLTVMDRFRRREAAGLLMYAALRWVETHGGEQMVAIGRREVLDLYLHVGFERLGREIKSGAVIYDLITTTASRIRARLVELSPLLNRLERAADWQMEFPFRKPAACFHGGAFFDAIGPEFDHLERRHTIINADVLDAWFPPSPRVIAALQEDLPWLLRTSPPTNCEGMGRAIARARGVPAECVLPGAGSSDLIFLALRQLLKPSSRVLILDPMYGEYAHVLEKVVGCGAERIGLRREDHYQLKLATLADHAACGHDLIVLVNPNSPTGQHVPRVELENILRRIPPTTQVWVDETYVEYAGPNQSLEPFVAASRNVVVCKSMSKVYAVSGVRSAYLCGPLRIIEELRGLTPPWAVSLPAQAAAVAALQDPDYYAARYAKTHELQEKMATELQRFAGWEIIPGIANFLLCHLPPDGPDAATLVQRCREHGLFLRDVGAMGTRLGDRALRIAVKDEVTNVRIVELIRQCGGRLKPSAETCLPAHRGA